MRPSSRFIAPLILTTLLAGLLSAAPAVERVSVKKTDGTTVAGTLLWADPDGVGVQGAKDPVLVEWKDIASISNGLTRPKAISQWKIKNEKILCDICHGDRTVKHEACNGTGVAPETKKDCETCKGTGTGAKCTNAKCVEGKVECPGPCLKRSVGVWKDTGGLLWREFPVAGGGKYRISQGHWGQIWTLTADKSSMEMKGNCPQCNGEAKIACDTCLGKAHLPCKTCDAVGLLGPACKDCDHGQVKCTNCNGKGLVARK
jgi:hypothetical protein